MENLFHVDSLGCGTTRALYALFHLDIRGAVEYNRNIFIVLILLIYVWLFEIIKTIQRINKG